MAPVPISSSTLRRGAAAAALLALAALALGACLWITDRVLWQHESIGFLGVYVARLGLLAVAAGALFAVFALTIGQPRRARWVRRCLAACFAMAFTGLLLEAVFMYVPQSHSVGYTMAARIWYDDFWGPENSLGYRDKEPVRIAGRKLVFVVGDSFAAGAGVEHVESRFGDVMAAARPDLQVMNLGICGAETAGEFERLQKHPLRPDAVVLQYYVNDIDGAAQRAGHAMPAFTPYEDLRSVKLRFLVRGSFLANFVYWQFAHGDGRDYEQFLARMFADPEVERLHLQDLAKFHDWSRQTRIPLVVVLFPLLEDLAWSRAATAHVKQFFVSRDVPVLDVADLVDDLTPAQRLVNHHDGHASKVVHERVGSALARILHV